MTSVPEPVANVAEVMRGFPRPWYLCGGWAVDSWLGEQTRRHDDVDIAIFNDDGMALADHLPGWTLVAHEAGGDQESAEPWDGHLLALPAHLHGRPPGLDIPLPERVDAATEQGFGLDVQLNERSGEEWVLSREPRVALSLDRAARKSPSGLLTVVPEVLLFYKAQDLRRRDHTDFQALLPELDDEQRRWLREAIAILPHPWLNPLSL